MDTGTRAALRVAARFFILGALWVLLSDRVLEVLLDPEQIPLAQTLKGWLFMAVVAALIFAWVKVEMRLRERSRETEANLAILLNQSLTGVFAVRDGRFTYTNDRFNEILGYAPGELTGRSLTTIVEEGERVRVRHVIERAGSLRAHSTLSFRAVRADGSIIHTETQITQTELGGGAVVLGMLLDVTQRKVQEARYAATRRLEAIGRVAGGVAHDFNNLLTAITGAASLLRDRLNLPPDAREDVQVILDTADRGASLARHLLAFSHSRVTRAEPVDVSEIVRAMRPLLLRLLNERIDLELQLDRHAPILADRHQIEQIVLNLAVNARDAMPNGGRLRIATTTIPVQSAPPQARIAGSDRLVRLVVEDTGTGIQRDLHARVFEPYFTTKGERGTGLGLATVQNIVAQTGGHILLDSTPGNTVFTIHFPAAEQPREEVAAEPAAERASRRRHGRVLVVEDEPVVRAVTRRALEKAGFPVVEAQTGAEARRALADDDFVVVLLDVTLPDESGVDVARAALGRENGPAVVFMSGYSTEDVPIPDDMRPAGFVEKPFTMDEITTAVTRACG